MAKATEPLSDRTGIPTQAVGRVGGGLDLHVLTQ